MGLPRSGTTMLTGALGGERGGGVPDVWLDPGQRPAFARHWGLPPTAGIRAFHRSALRAGTTADGVFAVKVHHLHHLTGFLDSLGVRPDAPLDERLAAAFPNPRIVLHERADKVQMAISYLLALRSGWWTVTTDGPRPPAEVVEWTDVDRTQVGIVHEALHREEAAWRQALSDVSWPLLAVTYEELVADLAATCRRVARHLAIASPVDGRYAAKTVRQRDATSERLLTEWVEATGGCDRCGHAPAPRVDQIVATATGGVGPT